MAVPWETLETIDTPDGPLALLRRGEREFLLTVRGRVLMTSAAHRSEDDLARLACAHLEKTSQAHVLVSGLGMGFTLRAALDVLGPRARLVVAELNPVVAAWCKGPLAALTGGAANDGRVSLVLRDVAAVLREVAAGPPAGRFDVIVLDMYEGPQNKLSRRDPLYGPEAIAQTRRALVEGGTFAVWCEQPSADFERSLRSAGFVWERIRTGHGGRVHLVYVARGVTQPGPSASNSLGSKAPGLHDRTSPPSSGTRPPRRSVS